jgi:hypothetical protein
MYNSEVKVSWIFQHGPKILPTLEELEDYHPEEGMILANTTAIGMHPNVNETPLSKVRNLLS